MPFYLKPGLVASRAEIMNVDVVRAVQVDLRKIGYLHSGVDGVFRLDAKVTIRALQYNLINNQGLSSIENGDAPVTVVTVNIGTDGTLVQCVTGIFDQNVPNCFANMIADDREPKLAEGDDPVVANEQAVDAIVAHVDQSRPFIFDIAITHQESGGKLFAVPFGADLDHLATIGLDRNGQFLDRLTTRGYDIDQYTLFHHPRRQE